MCDELIDLWLVLYFLYFLEKLVFCVLHLSHKEHFVIIVQMAFNGIHFQQSQTQCDHIYVSPAVFPLT